MFELPAGYSRQRGSRFIKPIDINNPDFYQWGLNCRLLAFSEERVKALSNEAILDSGDTQQDKDNFWEGYFYGIKSLIAEHPELVIDDTQPLKW